MIDRLSDKELKIIGVREFFTDLGNWAAYCRTLSQDVRLELIAAKSLMVDLTGYASISHRLDVMNLTLSRIADMLEVIVDRGALQNQTIHANGGRPEPDQS